MDNTALIKLTYGLFFLGSRDGNNQWLHYGYVHSGCIKPSAGGFFSGSGNS